MKSLLELVYSSRVNLTGTPLDAPTILIQQALDNLVLELRLHGCNNNTEDGAVAYLTTLFQVVSDRLATLEYLDLSDAESLLKAAVDYAHTHGIDSEDIEEIVTEHISETTNEVSS
jgi:hypothetical protein